MRTVCGRIKSDYRYSASVVYNNFPWCNPTKEQKETIEDAAHGILDARAVMAAYGFNTKMTESECVAELFKMYEELTKKSN
ncbi:hypothetical protein SAMN04487775_10114 [Treponema bryantii]|uniref:MmeI-like target recognition domain-containing protein n=2 Tax=Treponema bryantii TaxID=163 RepID=A0A1I3HR70_9SPIR|nr:type IIL restriction-modification enzyme MmeI [Treponema bryantii]SFI38113.1 hypothetical protein SAMN04487775_10114 [Treponema bryantii]